MREENFEGKKLLVNQKNKPFSSAVSKEFMIIQCDVENQIKEILNSMNDSEKICNSEKIKLSVKLMATKKLFKTLEKEIRNFKSLFNNTIQEQRVYYQEILKKGIDVRYLIF